MGTIVGKSEVQIILRLINFVTKPRSINQLLFGENFITEETYLNLKDCFKVINYIMHENLFNAYTRCCYKNYTVKEIIDIISKFTKVKKKFVNTEILNQNSYEVISDSLLRSGFKFSRDISQDIKNTLEILR